MTKVMAFDYGEARIGVAISDAMGLLARGLPNLDARNEKLAFAAIEDMIRKEGVGRFLVGLAMNMDGSEGPAAKKCRAFAAKLEKRFALPVDLWDERLTSVEADRLMLMGDLSRAKRKAKVDQLAARILLQSFLDSRGRKPPPSAIDDDEEMEAS